MPEPLKYSQDEVRVSNVKRKCLEIMKYYQKFKDKILGTQNHKGDSGGSRARDGGGGKRGEPGLESFSFSPFAAC